jgi:hypothetical protein
VDVNKIADAEKCYILGASFGVSVLENKYRYHMVRDLHSLLHSPNSKYNFNMLTKWWPEKILALTIDGMVATKSEHPSTRRLHGI